MRRLIAGALAAVLLVSTSCDSINDLVSATEAQSCGAENLARLDLDGDAMLSSPKFTEGEFGGQRRYFWSLTVDRVCTRDEGHTSANFTAVFRTETPHPEFGGEGRAYATRAANPYTVKATNKPPFLIAEVPSIGLEHAWGDGPGTMELEFLITFPATSNAAADRTRFLSVVAGITVVGTYKAYKQK